MNDFAQEASSLTFEVMPIAQAPETPSDFAGRLRLAMTLEKKTQSRTERESGLKSGYLSKLLGTATAKQIFSPGPEVIRKLADYLHVSYEWLAIGRGPIRSHGWAPTPFEEAQLVAERWRTRSDAIAAAAKLHRDDDGMTAIDWILAIDGQARRLERLGVRRPEDVTAQQRRVEHLASRKERLKGELENLERAERAETERPIEARVIGAIPTTTTARASSPATSRRRARRKT